MGGDDVFWWGVGGDVFGDDIFGGVWVVMTSESFVSDVTVAPFPLSEQLCFHTFYFCYFSDLIWFLMIKEIKMI